MIFFQVFVHARSLSPAEGQLALKRMMDQIDSQRAQGDSAVKVVAGSNIATSQIPDWLAHYLAWAGLLFDDVNFCYYKHYPTLTEARGMMDWFDRQFRPWLIAQRPQDRDFVEKQIQARVLDESHENYGLEVM